jgi:hypothetical protein
MGRILKLRMHAIGVAVVAITLAAGLFVAVAYAQTPTPTPLPSPSPQPAPPAAPSTTPPVNPTGPEQRESAHKWVQEKAKAVTDMEKRHGTRSCYWNGEDRDKHVTADSDLLQAIDAEAELSPEYRNAEDAANHASAAYNRIRDNNGSASDVGTAESNFKKAEKALNRALESERQRIKKRLEDEGFVFESEECKPHTTPPPKPPKPPEPPKKEPEKLKEAPKEKPKAAGEDEERQQMGGAPGCPGSGGQPCSSTKPSGSENEEHDSGGLGSFLGNVSIGIGVGGHGEGHRHDASHRSHEKDKHKEKWDDQQEKSDHNNVTHELDHQDQKDNEGSPPPQD